MKKIGAIFMVTVFALAGVGASYAGFFDIINVHGEVSTAYVDYEFTDWSGTFVWKDTGQTNEIYMEQGSFTPGATPSLPTYNGNTPFSYAWAYEGDGNPNEVEIEFYNIFPLESGYAPYTVWKADFTLHYLGSIPGYFYPTLVTPPNLPTDITFDYNAYDLAGNELTWPVQLHYCDSINIVITIDITQPTVEDSPLEGLGNWDKTIPEPQNPLEFSMDFELIQWNEEEYS